jgi:ceramide glucosyltransferase
VLEAGRRVVTARMPVPTWNEGWTFSRFVNRHLRWAVMRRQVSRVAYAMEMLLTPGPLLMVLLALGCWFPESGIAVGWVAACVAFDQLLDYITYCRMTGQPAPPITLLLNPLRQWLTLAIWALGWFVQSVQWRGKTYRVGAGSRLRPVAPLPAASTTSVPR